MSRKCHGIGPENSVIVSPLQSQNIQNISYNMNVPGPISTFEGWETLKSVYRWNVLIFKLIHKNTEHFVLTRCPICLFNDARMYRIESLKRVATRKKEKNRVLTINSLLILMNRYKCSKMHQVINCSSTNALKPVVKRNNQF